MLNPLVSIIVPTFNREKLIEDTLNSILMQTYNNWECIIVDDHSSDKTEEVVRKYLNKDQRFKFFTRPNSHLKGPSGCRNFGLEMSSGEFINWFDSDDLMMPNKIEDDLILLQNGDKDFTISQAEMFNHFSNEKISIWNNNLYSLDPINDFILKKIGWSVNSPLWNKRSLERVNLKFNEKLFNGDDYEYHIKALVNGLKPVVINKIKVACRVHPDRIENHKNKAHSKSLIVLDLLENKLKYQLSDECIEDQIELCFYLLKNMYKQKLLKEGIVFSKKLYNYDLVTFKFQNLMKYFLAALFYKITGRGYSIFDKI